MNENQIGTIIIEKAIKVHKNLGPGLFESVYEKCLIYELKKAELKVISQIPIPIQYGPISFDEGFRADLIVEDIVLIELKSIESFTPVHKKQVQTYLKLSKLKLGYLLNFNESLLKNGIIRCVNGL